MTKSFRNKAVRFSWLIPPLHAFWKANSFSLVTGKNVDFSILFYWKLLCISGSIGKSY